MWTPERDHELRRLGADAFAGRYQIPLDEASARYMVLFDPEGQAALLREKNRAIEDGEWTQPKEAKAPPKTVEPPCNPWPDIVVQRLRKMYEQGLSDRVIACRLGKSLNSVQVKRRRLGLLNQRKD